MSVLILAYAAGFALAFGGALYGLVVVVDEIRRKLRQWRLPAILRIPAIGGVAPTLIRR